MTSDHYVFGSVLSDIQNVNLRYVIAGSVGVCVPYGVGCGDFEHIYNISLLFG